LHDKTTTTIAPTAGASDVLPRFRRGAAPFHADAAPPSTHDRCGALSTLLRGKLCEQLASRRGRRHGPGQTLYVIGDPAKSVYYVKSGLVKVSRASASGEQIILQIYRPGDFLGELCFCSGERRDEAVVLESSEIVEIALADLLARLRQTPEAALDLVVALSRQLEALHDRMQSLAFESAMERLARTLLMLADTLGEETPEGTHIAHYVRQEELAQMVAARREVVSGLLNRLREAALISYPRKGQISVHRRPLEEFLKSFATKRGK
jgi:CRP/FNR family cyclic AMP-dependent transcriptional regulator